MPSWSLDNAQDVMDIDNIKSFKVPRIDIATKEFERVCTNSQRPKIFKSMQTMAVATVAAAGLTASYQNEKNEAGARKEDIEQLENESKVVLGQEEVNMCYSIDYPPFALK